MGFSVLALSDNPFGGVVFLLLIGIGINVMFGFWGKSRAEDHGVEPWIGFLAGFFLGFIGILIIPILRTDRIVNVRRPAPPTMHYPPPYAPPHAGQPQYAPPPQQYAPPQPDADGYIACPACGSRTKAERRSCMACGASLPQTS